jgi:hypothetical protein
MDVDKEEEKEYEPYSFPDGKLNVLQIMMI